MTKFKRNFVWWKLVDDIECENVHFKMFFFKRIYLSIYVFNEIDTKEKKEKKHIYLSWSNQADDEKS